MQETVTIPLLEGESAAELSETCIPNAKAGARHIATPMERVLPPFISRYCDMLKLVRITDEKGAIASLERRARLSSGRILSLGFFRQVLVNPASK